MTRKDAEIDPSERREVSTALVAQIGFDPFRILDNDLPGDTDADRQFRSIVGGMNRLATVRAWKAAERRLGRGADGGPREGVVRLLDQREEWLKEHGDLAERLPGRTPEELRERGRELYAATKVVCDDEEGDKPLTAEQKLARIRAGEHPNDESGIAADGGSL